LKIEFPGGKVIETRISKALDDDISHFSLLQTSDEAVRLNWIRFDPGQYLKITTIVTSATPLDPEITGSLFGVNIASGRPPSALGPFDYALGMIFGGIVVTGFLAVGLIIFVGVARNFLHWRDWNATTFFQTLLAIGLGAHSKAK
jgi:hypothetical protein